jgi:LysR family transcriptional regulator, transcriptional activator of the cysJI operon
MTFRHLDIYAAVREAGSMTKAAERLAISQPSVSQAIKELEAEFGSPLFDRLGKKLVATAAGELFLGYAKRILEAREELSDAMRGAAVSGPIRLGATVTIGTYMLSRIIGLSKRPIYPVVENTSRIERLILEGDLDLALVEGETSSPLLVRRRFYRDRLKIVCSPGNPAWKSKAGPRELSGRGFYLREPGSGSRELFTGAMRRKGIAYRIAGELNNTEALKNLVRADDERFAVVSELAVDDSVRVVEVPGLELERSFDIVHRRDKRIDGELSDFVERVAKMAAAPATAKATTKATAKAHG